MKLLLPLDLFYPSKIGGPANTLNWMGQALVGIGHKVSVVTTTKGIEPNAVHPNKWQTTPGGINVFYCKTNRKIPLSVIWRSLMNLKSADTVLFSSICFIPNFFIALAAKYYGKKIVWSPRGELFETAIEGSKIKKMYFNLLNKLFGYVVTFHATSSEEKIAIERYFPRSKICVIPNYMELPNKIEPESDHEYFLFLGRIAPIKAIENILEALAISREFRQSRFSFKIVGGVENQFLSYYKKLQDLIQSLKLQDKVVFEGSITGSKKYKMCADARYLLLMSHSENFGNVVIEALSQGTPVIASKGTPWDKLEENNAGYWIDNSPECIAGLIDRVIGQSETQYDNKRSNAYLFSQSFDVSKHITEWEKILFS